MITYEPFWKTIEQKNISTYTLINKYHVSGSTISRLKNNKGISTNTINDLCTILDCRVEEVLEYLENN